MHLAASHSDAEAGGEAEVAGAAEGMLGYRDRRLCVMKNLFFPVIDSIATGKTIKQLRLACGLT